MKKTLESGYIQHVRKNAEAKKPWAQKAMGDVFYYGIGMEDILDNMAEKEKRLKMEENHKEAFKWYSKAAKQVEASAMHAVGRSYYFGEGIEENDKEAAKWYHKAAKVGDAESLYSLARMYERGIGMKPNAPKAADLYLNAINNHSHKNSLYSLAQLYLNNIDNPKIKSSPHFVWRLLFSSAHIAGNVAAENDIGKLRLLDYVSPVQRKQIWEDAYNDLQQDWDSITQYAVSGIDKKIAVAQDFSAPLLSENVFNRVWRSVVDIRTRHDNRYGGGSGVIVQPDIVATNHHVVKNADEIWVHQPKERSGKRNVPYPVGRRYVWAKGGEDYCLLHVPNLPGSGVPATVRPYNELKIGEAVYALGAPDGEVLSLSKGIISQLRDVALYPEGYTPTRAIQSDVDIAPGSSGGGLFDSAGNLIGHTTFGSNEKGLNFSIPADIILEFGKEQEPE